MKFTGQVKQQERTVTGGGAIRLFCGRCGDWTASQREVDGQLEIRRDGWPIELAVVIPWVGHADRGIRIDGDGYPVTRPASALVVNIDDAVIAEAVETQLRRPLAESAAAVGTVIRRDGYGPEQDRPVRPVHLRFGWRVWAGVCAKAAMRHSYVGGEIAQGTGLCTLQPAKLLAAIGA